MRQPAEGARMLVSFRHQCMHDCSKKIMHCRRKLTEYDARWKRWREEAKSEQGPRPPWVEFEGYAPWLPGWSQSVAEDWLTFCWFPYWDKLDASKRSAYLDRWYVGLDREWQEWLSFIDDPQRKKKSGS